MPHVHDRVVHGRHARAVDGHAVQSGHGQHGRPRAVAGPARRLPARWVLGASLGTGVLLVTVPGAASAAVSAGRPAAAPVSALSSLRGADLSPDTAGVIISLRPMAGGAAMDLSGATSYGQAGAYRQVVAGRYQVALRQAAGGTAGAALLTWSFQAQPGAAYTVAAVGKGTQRRGVVLRDDLTPPARGTARVRLIQAASVAVQADVTADGTITLARNAPFPSVTGYAQVPAGTWPVSATTVGSAPVTTKAKISLQPGSVTSLLLLDAPGGGLALRSAVDSVGAATPPRGGVNTGGGGTATSFVRPASAGTGDDVAAGLAIAGVLALAGGTARRRGRLRRDATLPVAAP